jgi:hypothetical protein
VLVAISAALALVLALPASGGATTSGLATVRWGSQRTVHAAPRRLGGNAIAYYPDAGQLVVFGNQDANTSTYSATTMVFDGTDWAERTPAHVPPARIQGSMAYDPASHRLILFGGYSGTAELADTWAWDGTDWAQLDTATHPSARANEVMARTASGIILYGGQKTTSLTTSDILQDTWRWTGTAWVEDHPAHSPGPRARASMDWFPDSSVAVLYGGTDASAFKSDTWTWNGTDWAQVAPDATPDPYRSNIAYNAANHTMMLFGGTDESHQAVNTLWLLGSGAWVGHPSSNAPGARTSATLVYDSTRAATLLIDANTDVLWKFPPPVSSLGGQLLGGPDATSWAPGRVDVFVRGTDNGLWHKWGDGNVWSGWEGQGGGLTSDPTAASWGPNRIDVFGRGTDNQLWHKWWDGGSWQRWEPLGGVLTSAPDVTSWGPNRLDVFGRGTDNQLWHKWWDGARWQGWEPLGGTLTSEPGVAANSHFNSNQDRIDVFVLGTDNAVWHLLFEGSWKGWDSMGGSWDSGPDVSRLGVSSFDVAVRNGDGVAGRTYQENAPKGEWQFQGVPSTAAPSVVSDVIPRQDLFTRGPGGDLLHSRGG